MQNETDRAKRALGDGTWSDHLTLLRAYDGWLEARAGGGGRERDYAWRNFLSTNTLAMIREMKKQLCDLLRDAGFVPRHLRLDALKHDPDYNGEAANTNLVRAILCAGLYPHVIKATRAGKRMRFSKRAVRSDAGSEAAGLSGDDDGGAGRHLTEKVELHPSSILAREQFLPARWLVYHEVRGRRGKVCLPVVVCLFVVWIALFACLSACACLHACVSRVEIQASYVVNAFDKNIVPPLSDA